MIKNRFLLRAISVTLLLIILPSTLGLNQLLALTSGPTQPEYSSFEPVDVTDMVNLATGDFTYTLPLLEVPGPEGGYPLALSYHGGIKTLQEASWVGLGWTLNPGAINRDVNNIPDDTKGFSTVRNYWGGGETYIKEFGLNLALAPTALGVGLQYVSVNDTYKGFGSQFSMMLSASFGPAFASLGISAGSLNGTNLMGSGGVGLGIGLPLFGSISAGVNAGFSIGQAGNEAHIGVGYSQSNFGMTMFSVGASISTNKGASTSVTGVGIQQEDIDNKYGTLSTFTKELKNITIPFLIGSINIKKSYTRYWMDVTDSTKNFGSLYGYNAYNDNYYQDVPLYDWVPINEFVQNKTSDGNNFFTKYTNNTVNDDVYLYNNENFKGPYKRTFDCHVLYQPDINIIDHPDPEWLVGASFPSYDTYQVLAQGLSGVMRPHIFDNASLFRKMHYPNDGCNLSSGQCGDYTNYRTDYPFTDNKTEFRFIGDFSNAVLNKENVSIGSLSSTANLNYIKDFTAQDHRKLYGGSRHIEWFTNNEIVNGTAQTKGFIKDADYLYSIKYKQGSYGNTFFSIKENIGGFSVTNETGITYHYAVPVYNVFAYSYNGKRDEKGSLIWRKDYNSKPYAYSWLLTSITGPDFVDRNNNGIADDDDWGYYINFRYGKWADNYYWRIPFEGTIKDIDNETETFTFGQKQLYYLDAVETRTHTALFVKDIRNDAKGVTTGYGGIKSEMLIKDSVHVTYDMFPWEVYNNSTIPDMFNPQYAAVGKDRNGFSEDRYSNISPTSTMKLDKIILLDKSNLTTDLNSLRQSSSELEHKHYIKATNNNIFEFIGQVNGSATHYLHRGTSVLDKYDNIATLEANALKVIKFDHTYELAPETLNSMPNTSNLYINSYSGYVQIPNERTGKLTLKAVKTYGKAGASVIPPTEFEYDLDSPSSTPGSFSTSGSYGEAQISANFSNYNQGDIVKFEQSGKTMYSLLYFINPNKTIALVKIIGANDPSSGSISFTKTKNPPFNKENYDNWGYYKPDVYKESILLQRNDYNERIRGALAVNDIDAWSVKKIKSPIGSHIDITLSSDQFSNTPLTGKTAIIPPIFYNNSSKGKLPLIFKLDNGTFSAILSANYYNYFVSGQSCELRLLSEKNSIIKKFNYDDNLTKTVTINSVQYNYGNGSFLIGGNTYNYGNSLGTITVNFSISNPPLNANFFNKVLTTQSPILWNDSYCRSAYFITQKPDVIYGGDIRTDKITYTSANGTYSTEYNYNNGNISSGVIPYEAISIPTVFVDKHPGFTESNTSDNSVLKKTFLNEAYQPVTKLLTLGAELPNSTNIYGNIEVTNKANGIYYSKSRFKYQTFTPSMFVYKNYDNNTTGSNPLVHSATNKIVDKTSELANLLSFEVFDKNNHLIIGTYNNYSSDNLNKYNNQGIITETFNETRLKQPSTNDRHIKRVVSIKETQPSVLTSTKTVTNGQTNTTYYQAYDFYNGQATEIVNENYLGEKYITFIKPAYKEYPKMGLKTEPDGATNKHMIAQTFSTYTYKASYNIFNTKYEKSGNPISADIQTWRDAYAYRIYNPTIGNFEWQTQNNTNIWRKDKNYTYKTDLNPDGTFSGSFTEFNKNNTATYDANYGTGWLLVAENTTYDWFSKLLEQRALNNAYASVKLGYNDSRVIASMTDTKYDEFAVTSAEQSDMKTFANNIRFFGTEVRNYGAIETVPANVHSGYSSVKAGAGNIALLYKLRLGERGNYKPRTYKASVWIKGTGQLYYKIYDQGTDPATVTPAYVSTANDVQLTINGWNLVSIDIPVTQQDINTSKIIEAGTGVAGTNNSFAYTASTSGTSYFDDFRFHPVSSPMTSYVYNSFGELTYILDVNNVYTRFEYDNSGKLKAMYKETLSGEKKISEKELTFKLPLSN